MKRRFVISIGFLFAVFLFGAAKIEACSCVRPAPPVASYKTTPIVFIGTVKSIQEDIVKAPHFGTERAFRTGLVAYLDVDEALKGIDEKQATVFTGGGGGDCGFPFQVGEKYLIFAYPAAKPDADNVIAATVIGNPNPPAKKAIVGAAMSTNICSLTGNLKTVTDALEMIHAFREGKPAARIYGGVYEYAYDFDGGISPNFVGVMPGLTVVAEGEKGRFEAKTDEIGSFSIKNLPPGKYTLKFLLPPTHTTLWDWESSFPVELKSSEDSAEMRLSVQLQATISGKILDWQGKPVGGDVQLSLIPVEAANKPIAEVPHRSEYTKRNGNYVFTGVKPGKYILGVNVAEAPARNTPYPKTYFPSTSDAAKAKVIEIAIGQKITNIDLKMPKQLERFVVQGTVVSADGKPVANAELDLYDSETPTERVFGFSDNVKSDAQGRFQITGFKGRRYLIHAYKDTNYIAGEGVQSERAEVVFDASAKTVKLVLNRNGIFIDQLK